ncbi:hypothetical protein D5086_017698 [Populus alba]|uniref:Uncharacterized protein n=1 Tax=Populus alba TaxID=43335 RepID=A0ACC4BMN8_POPAL
MKSVKTSGFTANGSSTSLPSYIFKSSQSHATFVHTLFALVDPEDSWPLIHRRKVRRISLIDIKESLVFVPSVEKVYKDVSIVKEANTFIPHIKEMCLKRMRISVALDFDVKVIPPLARTPAPAYLVFMLIRSFSQGPYLTGVGDAFSRLNLGYAPLHFPNTS